MLIVASQASDGGDSEKRREHTGVDQRVVLKGVDVVVRVLFCVWEIRDLAIELPRVRTSFFMKHTLFKAFSHVG